MADDNPPSRTHAFRTRGGEISFDDCFAFAQRLENDLDTVTRDRDKALYALKAEHGELCNGPYSVRRRLHNRYKCNVCALIKELEEAKL